MKILTIHPSWAQLIFSQRVDVLNVPYTLCNYHSKTLGIHAAKTTPPVSRDGIYVFIRNQLGDHDIPTIEKLRDRGETGAIIGTVTVGGLIARSNWGMYGMFKYQVHDVRKLPIPIPAKGHPWLWNYDLEEVSA